MRSLSSKISLSGIICSLCVGGFFALIPSAKAAEQISFRVSGAERSVAVADLRKLVNTGEQSDTLRGLLGTAGVDVNVVRGYLGMSIDLKRFDINVVLVDKFLNSYLIDLLLLDLGKAVRSPGGESGSVEAIKSAIIGAVADDNKISVIEFLEKYPTEMIVEVDRLMQIQQRVSKDYANLAEPFAKILPRLQMSR